MSKLIKIKPGRFVRADKIKDLEVAERQPDKFPNWRVTLRGEDDWFESIFLKTEEEALAEAERLASEINTTEATAGLGAEPERSREPGDNAVFMREGSAWHGKPVTIFEDLGNGIFSVVKTADVISLIDLSLTGKAASFLRTETATEAELW